MCISASVCACVQVDELLAWPKKTGQILYLAICLLIFHFPPNMSILTSNQKVILMSNETPKGKGAKWQTMPSCIIFSTKSKRDTFRPQSSSSLQLYNLLRKIKLMKQNRPYICYVSNFTLNLNCLKDITP